TTRVSTTRGGSSGRPSWSPSRTPSPSRTRRHPAAPLRTPIPRPAPRRARPGTTRPPDPVPGSGRGADEAGAGAVAGARGYAPGDVTQRVGGGAGGALRHGRVALVRALPERDVDGDLTEERDLGTDGATEGVGDHLAAAGAEELLTAAVGQLEPGH